MGFIERTRRGWAVVLFAVGLPSAADELRVFELRHRPAEEILAVIRPLLGREDAASATGFRLIVRSTDKRLQEIERLLTELDVPRIPLTLLVRYTDVSERARTTYGVSGQAPVGEHGRIVVGSGEAGGSEGLVAEHNGMRLHAERTTTTARREHIQRLRVLDGQRAYIQIGQSLPHVQQILVLAGKQAVLSQEGVVLQRVTSGFDVLPRVRGDQVILEITPRLASVDDPSHAVVRLTELATTVTVRRGEWVDLGELGGTSEALRRAILESGTQRAGARQTILITVE